MNNMNLIINICYLLITSGVIGALGKMLSKKAKDKHFADGLISAQTMASQLVAKYAIDPVIAKGQIKDAVTHDLQVALDKHGYHFSAKYLVAVAIKEIQHYENNGGSFKAEPTNAPQESLKHVEQKLNNSNSSNNDKLLDPNTQKELNDLKNKGLVK